MQGRLQGKRLTATHFLDDGRRARRRGVQLPARRRRRDEHGRRLRDVLVGARLRRLRDEARPRHAAPRPVARGHRAVPRRPRVGRRRARRRRRRARSCARQLDRLAERGLEAVAAHRARVHRLQATPTRRRSHKGYRDLEPANLYNVDYSMLGTVAGRAADPPDPQRDGRRRHGGRELQGRVQPRPARDQLPLRAARCSTADEHSIYKNGAKEIADQEGMAITFMAKFDEREGTSCHIHLSLQREDGTPVFADDTPAFDRFVAGQLACLRELTLFYAPNINSYKRFADGSFAPTAVAWGDDNRTCSLRVVGHGDGAADRAARAGRRRQPVPRAGRDDRRRACTGSTASSSSSRRARATPTRPTSRACRGRCARPRDLFARAARSRARRSARRSSTTTSTTPRVELAAFDAAVTDWERPRGFERL